MSVIQRGLGKLKFAPEVVNGRFRDGGAARIVKSDLNVRFLIQGIPSKPVGWDFRAFMQQVVMLEEAEKVIIKIVPMQALD